MRLIDQWISCEVCEERMDYEGRGEWLCECGHQFLADWLEPEGFAAWLESVVDVEDLSVVHPSLFRRLTGWRRAESKVNAYTADRFLVKFGLTFDDIPDDLWVERTKRRSTRPISPEIQKQALALVAEGMPKEHVARQLGITSRSIRNFEKAAA